VSEDPRCFVWNDLWLGPCVLLCWYGTNNPGFLNLFFFYLILSHACFLTHFFN